MVSEAFRKQVSGYGLTTAHIWQEKLEGPLHSVTVAHSRLIKPAELHAVNGTFRLN